VGQVLLALVADWVEFEAVGSRFRALAELVKKALVGMAVAQILDWGSTFLLVLVAIDYLRQSVSGEDCRHQVATTTVAEMWFAGKLEALVEL
jgi:hypothetical protein